MSLLVPVMALIMALKNRPCDGLASSSSPSLSSLTVFDWVTFTYISSASVQDPLTLAHVDSLLQWFQWQCLSVGIEESQCLSGGWSSFRACCHLILRSRDLLFLLQILSSVEHGDRTPFFKILLVFLDSALVQG